MHLSLTALTLSGLFSAGLLFARVIYTGRVTYVFLLWNLFLAALPVLLAILASRQSSRGSRTGALLLGFAWLLFFPNAPYILTDLQHLGSPKPGVPVWFDVLLIIWFAWTGLLLGMVSLFLMQDIVRREFGGIAGWFFVFAVGFLSSLGIYIGRFLRWNSWDMFFNPLGRLTELLYYAAHPSMQSIIFISVFATFFIFFYTTIYAFGRLLQEQAPKTSQETL